MCMSHDIVTWSDSDWHVQNQNWKRHQAQENARSVPDPCLLPARWGLGTRLALADSPRVNGSLGPMVSGA